MRSFDPSKLLSYLMYYDVNNLYGWAMCQPLPNFNGSKTLWTLWARSLRIHPPVIFLRSISSIRSIYTADTLTYFSPTRDKLPGKREDKLLATLYDKQRYVIHYRNLQQCTRHSLRVTKIHRVLQFAQSPWLRDYIELNAQFRTRAKNDFEKNLYKLINNAVFGRPWRMCAITLI